MTVLSVQVLIHREVTYDGDYGDDEARTQLHGPTRREQVGPPCDNSEEFTFRKHITETEEYEPYFAQPCPSWERGTNENDPVRQSSPKGTDFDQVTDDEIAAVKRLLNMTPSRAASPQSADRSFCNRYSGRTPYRVLRLLVEFRPLETGSQDDFEAVA